MDHVILGTFLAHNETNEKRWEAKVEYLLEAEVINASRALAVSRMIYYHCLKQDFLEPSL